MVGAKGESPLLEFALVATFGPGVSLALHLPLGHFPDPSQISVENTLSICVFLESNSRRTGGPCRDQPHPQVS